MKSWISLIFGALCALLPLSELYQREKRMLHYFKTYLATLAGSLKNIRREDVHFAMLCVLVAFIMLTMDRFGLQNAINPNQPFYKNLSLDRLPFWSQVHFTVSSVILYLLIPLFFHFIFPLKEKATLGLRGSGVKQYLWIYLIILLVMVPLAWIACGDPSFNRFYPMYNPESMKAWALYEVIYLTQFFTVEFFFRGFTLFWFEQRFGALAVWLIMIPYSFIHIHKPFPEALGSIIAGVVLGGLALKTRSIWPGVLVHCGVAFSVDFFALLRSGRFMKLWY